ncbi:MAG: MFS transporter [Promethearchaeota archaeon]
MEVKNLNLRIIYPLAFIGDLTLSMLLVLSILYGTNAGLSTIEVGLIGGAYGFAYIFMSAILGRISDIISRKISLMIAISVQTILTLLFMLIITQAVEFVFFGLFLVQLLYGIAYGFFWPSIEAYVSENTEYSSIAHQKGIGNFCISWSIGFALGPFFAGMFYDFDIIIALVLIFICYASIFFLILFKMPKAKPRNKNLNKNVVKESLKLNKLSNQKTINSNSKKILVLLLMGVTIYATISKMLLSYFTNYAALPEGLNWTGTLIGLVMFFFGLGRTFYFIFARYLKNSFSALSQSFVLIALCLIVLAFLYPPTLIAIILFITGFFVGRTYLVSLELLLKYEQEKKGTKAGIFESMVGIGSALSPFFAGMIATINLKMPFFIFAAIVFIFVIIHIFLKKSIQFEDYKNDY